MTYDLEKCNIIAELMDAFYKPIWLSKDLSLNTLIAKVTDSP